MNRCLCAIGATGLVLAACTSHQDRPDGSGTIEATEVRVAMEVAGRLEEVAIDEGRLVTNGARLARIDPAGYEMKAREARAARDLARAQLDLLLAGSRDEDIRRARAQAEEARAAAWAAGRQHDRVRKVFEEGHATAQQADDAKAMSDRAAAAQAAAEEQVARVEKGSREEEIRAARAALAQAEARLALAEKALRDTEVRSPLDGVVLIRSAEPGEVVAPGTPLGVLARLDEVWLSAYVSEPRLAGVKVGQPVRVRVDGRANDFTGTVAFVSPQAEFTPRNVQTAEERTKLVFRVKITLANPEGVFKPGLPADVWLH